MATKAILSVTAAVPADKVEATRARVAAHLGLAVEDVLVVHGATVTVADVPEPKRAAHTEPQPVEATHTTTTTPPAPTWKKHTEK